MKRTFFLRETDKAHTALWVAVLDGTRFATRSCSLVYNRKLCGTLTQLEVSVIFDRFDIVLLKYYLTLRLL